MYFQVKCKIEDVGKHLQAVDDYIQQHSLMEAQLHSLAKRTRNLNRRSRQHSADGKHPEGQLLEKRLEDLNKELDRYVQFIPSTQVSSTI